MASRRSRTTVKLYTTIRISIKFIGEIARQIDGDNLLFQRVLLGYRNHSVLHATKNLIKTGKRDAQVVKPTSWDNHSLTLRGPFSRSRMMVTSRKVWRFCK
jgi:hypothetical protein